MPSRVRYRPSTEWLRSLLRMLRIPIVFALSAVGSYCAFQDGGALFNGGPMTGASAGGGGRVRIAVWDADLLPDGSPLRARGDAPAKFGEVIDPDVLILYNVPTFAALLKLRDALRLSGYTAAMSNFFCDGMGDGPKWPLEVAILSRFPIDQAIEFDPPTNQFESCASRGPSTEGPVVASHRTLEIPKKLGLRWPVVGGSAKKPGHPLPGPGYLVVRIDSARVVVGGIRVGLASEYPNADPRAVNAMRQALTASLGAWIWKERNGPGDDHFLAAGDFGVDTGEFLAAGVPLPGNADNNFDGADTILTQGVIGGGPAAQGGHDDGQTGLRMANLTRALVVQTVGSEAGPHSGRIYLWSHRPGVFGLARRGQDSYGSHGYPLIVESSGGTCAIDPMLTWMRRGPTFAGLSKQIFTASFRALEDQIAAMGRRKEAPPWVVSLDLDDVVIDNSPFLYDMAQKCQLPTVADWNAWVDAGHAQLLPGVSAFMAKARALASGGRGRILIFTKRRADQAAETEKLLTRLGVIAGPGDPIVKVEYGVGPQSRTAAWRAATSGGQRIALVVGNSTEQFPNDPHLPVGGTASSCPNPLAGQEQRLRLFGPQTARFGVCYFLVPARVL